MRLALLFWIPLGTVVGSGCAPDPTDPDVLVVTLDTFRGDHLGAAGYPRATTPHLDALAAEGVRFATCRAPVATTLPSHLSLFTGAHPLRHGVLANLTGEVVQERDPELAVLAESFEQAGYATAAFVSAFVLRPGVGLDAGFETYDAPDAPQRVGRATVARARSWWQEAEGPRFLWVHLFDPHLPHEPPPELRSVFRDDALAESILDPRGVPRRPELVAHLNAYDRELVETDRLVGELLEEVGARTVVLAVGDHGEGLWQHGWEGHGYLWDEQLLVPALLRAPGLEPAVDQGPRAVTDLAPLLLEQVPGVPAPQVLHQARRTRELLGEGHLALANPRGEFADPLTRALWVEGPWALVRRVPRADPGRVEHDLFDLRIDPAQLRSLTRARPAVVARLEARLLQVAERLGEGSARRDRAATEAEQAALEALGYGGSSDPGDR